MEDKSDTIDHVSTAPSLARKDKVKTRSSKTRFNEATIPVGHVERLLIQRHHGIDDETELYSELSVTTNSSNRNRKPECETAFLVKQNVIKESADVFRAIGAAVTQRLNTSVSQTQQNGTQESKSKVKAVETEKATPSKYKSNIASNTPSLSEVKNRETSCRGKGDNTSKASLQKGNVVQTACKKIPKEDAPEHDCDLTAAKCKIDPKSRTGEERSLLPLKFHKDKNNNNICPVNPQTKGFTSERNSEHSSKCQVNSLDNIEEAYGTSSIFSLQIKKSAITNAIEKTRRSLLGMVFNTRKDLQARHSDVKTFGTTAISPSNKLNCTNLSYSSSSSDSNSESNSFVEFEHDLDFLSKCANMTSSPDNRLLKEETKAKVCPKSSLDDGELSLPPPDTITRSMYSTISHIPISHRQRSPLAISPLAISNPINRQDKIDVQNRVTRIGQYSPGTGGLQTNRLNHSTSNELNDNINFREKDRCPFGAICSAPVRRCLSFSQKSPPLTSLTDAAKSQSTGVTAPMKPEPVRRFRNEDEEAVYYLIKKYLQNDENNSKTG